MEQYNVTGMSCAACSARVEKAVRAVPGVESCSVNLLTNSMGVTGMAAPELISRRNNFGVWVSFSVSAAGCGAAPPFCFKPAP